MKYGCIGERLSHSFSKEIHNALADYDYELCEVARDALDSFAGAKNFKAINVTIPYKELIIPHLHYIDEDARAIGAVNTVVNRDGLLYGYNTDFYGMSALMWHLGISLFEKKIAILGSGGTSKTAMAVCRAMGARMALRVSRTAKDGAISYEELFEKHTDTEVIINTTPVGMFPSSDGLCIDIDKFPALSGCIDTIYNPLRTPFIMKARERGIPAEGGLYMLVAQAVRASEIFLGKTYPEGTLDEVYNKVLKSKENIVLIGMPASGKSTVGALLADKLSRSVLDTDDMVIDAAGCEIAQIFKEKGEVVFRDMESEAVRSASRMTCRIIATGGGAVLRPENLFALRQNGRLYFIDRPLSKLIPTASRPLSSDRAAIERRFDERYEIYCSSADVRIDADCGAEEVCNKILENFGS